VVIGTASGLTAERTIAADLMPHICSDCVRDPVLQSLAQAVPDPLTCVLCTNRSRTVIDLDLRHTRQVLRALLRFHFDEWAYNGHLGGDSIEQVLCRPNPIFDHSNAEGVEELCWAAYEGGYETDDIGVSLFAGYHDGNQLSPLPALAHAEDPLVSETRRRLKVENHFHLAARLEMRIGPLRTHIEKDVANGLYFRARIGVSERAIHRDTGQSAYVPYSRGLLLAPPPPVATPGRINRTGVSFLYVASTISTAVAEVRPHPGHLVSTGEVRQTQPCKLADFSKVWLAEFSDSDARLDDFLFLRTLESDFATPVVPEERTRYLLGQLVADVLRQMGFHGVAYRSSVADGTNFCFFEPARFEYVENSGTVVDIRALRYDTEPAKAIPLVSEEYWKPAP